MKMFIILLFLLALNLFALDIDEKLTLRILKVSETKRTILINRGIEDGLNVGDHAKLYLTTGMIARAIVVKVSPARSVWSIYRLITPSEIVKNRIVNLKIATPVKITSDPTRMITLEPVIKPGREIPVDNSYLRVTSNENELQSLRQDEDSFAQIESQAQANIFMLPRTKKTWEAFVSGYFNNLSSTTESEFTGLSESGSSSGYDINFGFEKYFRTSGTWYEKFSFTGLLSIANSNSSDANGNSTSNSFFGFGGGVNYHFYNHPLDRGKIIGFGLINFGVGTVTDTTESALTTASEINGDASFLSFGGGAKYYVDNFGIKLSLEYYRRAESFVFDDGDEVIKTLGGPRVQVGLLYRF